jgi:hypothetical protein
VEFVMERVEILRETCEDIVRYGEVEKIHKESSIFAYTNKQK